MKKREYEKKHIIQCKNCPAMVTRAYKNNNRPPLCFKCAQERRRDFAREYMRAKKLK